MKRLLFLVLLGTIFSLLGYSQTPAFTIKTDSTIINGAKEFTITVDISSGTSPYSVYLCDKATWDGGVVIQQKLDEYSVKHVFTGLTQYHKNVIYVKGSGNNEYNWKIVTSKN